jgi:hypothetical protein
MIGPMRDSPFWPEPLVTDKDGRLTVRGVGRHQGVGLRFRDHRYAPKPVWLPAGSKEPAMEKVEVLEPAQVIEGRVVSADTGQPIPNARTAVVSYNQGGNYISMSTSAGDLTDAQGHFRLSAGLGQRFTVEVYASAGQPYLGVRKDVEWPKGAARQLVEIALPRGVLVRGKVTELPSGRPVAGARIIYHPRGSSVFALPENETNPNLPRHVLTYHQSLVLSQADGSFQIAAPAVPGHLLVTGPSHNYISAAVGNNELTYGNPGGLPRYYHAALAMQLTPGDQPKDVTITLRRGVALTGRLVGPDGKLVERAYLICAGQREPYTNAFPAEYESISRPVLVREGQFVLRGCDPEQTYRVIVDTGKLDDGALVWRRGLDAKLWMGHLLKGTVGRLGAAVELSAKQANGQPITIQLVPCGAAAVEFVDQQGRPMAGHKPLLELLVTSGLTLQDALNQGALGAETIVLAGPIGESNKPPLQTDARGRLVFPGLIPGATYRVDDGRKGIDFTVESGTTRSLSVSVGVRP